MSDICFSDFYPSREILSTLESRSFAGMRLVYNLRTGEMHRRPNGERQNVSRHQLARARVGDTVSVKVMGNRLEEGVDGEVVSATKSLVCVQC